MTDPGRLVGAGLTESRLVAQFERAALVVAEHRDALAVSWHPTGRPAAGPPAFDAAPGLGPAAPLSTSDVGTAVRSRGAQFELDVDHRGHVTIRASGGAILVESAGEGSGVGFDDRTVSWTLRMPAGASYYGCGERTGLLERRGRRYTCWTTDAFEGQSPDTDAMYVAVPFLAIVDEGGNCAGVYVGSTWRSSFDLTDLQAERYTIASDDPAGLAVVLIDGPDPASVQARFTALTGRMALPPLWALGFQQSRWGYRTAADIRTIVSEFRQRRIPVDAVGLDIDYMDEHRVFTWDRHDFPEPAELLADLRAAGCRAVAVNDCAVKIDPGRYDVYDEGVAGRCFLEHPPGRLFSAFVWPGRAALPDFAREDVRQWWGRHHRALTDAGVAGVANDMNEPSLRGRPLDDPAARRVEVPGDVLHGDAGRRATHSEVHNVYGLLNARACAEALRSLRPSERSLVLTRAGFAGVQRYAGIWTGDSCSSWEHLEMALPMMVNLGLSGVAFCGSDVGGFFGHCSAELLVRWMQLGTFSPLMRANNADGCTAQEPWVWGPATEDACRGAIELRYRLLPYIYTAFAKAHLAGCPVLSPLWWCDPADHAAREIADQALLGPDLLVAPVVRPGQDARGVYVPAGRWYDWRTGESHVGPRWILASARLDEPAPMFVRAGGVVPVGPVMQSTDDRDWRALDLHVYADELGAAGGEVYDDDGATFDHETGAWSMTRFLVTGETVRAEREGTFAPTTTTWNIVVHHPDGSSIRHVVEAGAGPSWEASW